MKGIVIFLFIVLSTLVSAGVFADETTSTTVTTQSDEIKPSPAGDVKETTKQTVTTTKTIDHDAEIIAAIEQSFEKDSALIGTSLTVTSEDGYVVISGQVTMQSQADQAMRLAKSIPGVKEVSSEMNILTNPQP